MSKMNNNINNYTLAAIAVADGLYRCKEYLEDIDKVKETIYDSINALFTLNYEELNDKFIQTGYVAYPVGWFSTTIREVITLTKAIASVFHMDRHTLKDAEAISMTIFLSRRGKSKNFIKQYISTHYFPELSYLTYDEILADYSNNYNLNELLNSEHIVEESLISFLESNSTEDAVAKVTKLGSKSGLKIAITTVISDAYFRSEDRLNYQTKLEKFSLDNRLLAEF